MNNRLMRLLTHVCARVFGIVMLETGYSLQWLNGQGAGLAIRRSWVRLPAGWLSSGQYLDG